MLKIQLLFRNAAFLSCASPYFLERHKFPIPLHLTRLISFFLQHLDQDFLQSIILAMSCPTRATESSKGEFQKNTAQFLLICREECCGELICLFLPLLLFLFHLFKYVRIFFFSHPIQEAKYMSWHDGIMLPSLFVTKFTSFLQIIGIQSEPKVN